MDVLDDLFSLGAIDHNNTFDEVVSRVLLGSGFDSDVDWAKLHFFVEIGPVPFGLHLGSIKKYSSKRVFQGTKHDNLLDIVVVAGIPEVVYYSLNGGLWEGCVGLIVEDGGHEAGIDVEIFDSFDLHAIVFVWVVGGVQVSTSIYRSLSFSECL